MTFRDEDWTEAKASIDTMIHALVDGELDEATARSVEGQIAADPALANLRNSILAMKAAMKHVPRPVVSDAFREKIASIAQPDSRQTMLADRSTGQTQTRQRYPSMRPLSRSYDWRALAASIAITAILAGGVTRLFMQSSAPDQFVLAIADDHRRSLLAASPFDIASSDRHTVKPWLDAKLGLSPPAPDLAGSGFALAGGRVEVIFDKPIPALVYRHHEHLITLVAEPSQNGKVTQPTDVSASGFSMVKWSDGAFSYWAISDTEWADLNDFVAQFRSAVIPM